MLFRCGRSEHLERTGHMRGTYRVVAASKRLKYDFTLRRNLTIIRGDSATGKTTLVDMIREHMDHPSGSPVTVSCDKECFALSGALWREQLSGIRDSIVFVDEGNEFVRSDEFARAVEDSDNYFVIVTREGLPALPYSITEIYGIRTSGKYGTLQQSYHEFYRLYAKEGSIKPVVPDTIITEDGNAGFQFFQSVCEQSAREVTCIPAFGKSNIFQSLKDKADGKTVAVVDGAAFGPEMDKVSKLLQENGDLNVYAPESFEWLILSSGIPEDREIRVILEDPASAIDSLEYVSWERYFTALLTEKTKGTIWEYSKRKLSRIYMTPAVRERILKMASQIQF